MRVEDLAAYEVLEKIMARIKRMKNNSALPAVIMWAVCVLLAICIILSVLPVSDRDDLQQAGARATHLQGILGWIYPGLWRGLHTRTR